MKGAYQVASSNKDLSAAVDKLKGSFWATTSNASRDIKRGEVMKLAKMLESAEDNVFPLSQTLVEKVAACLKASNMKSGDQYLNELKLRHVEEGHDLPPWLIRPFSMCKKALTRCKGPTKRALEAKLEGISDDAWAATKRKAGEGIDPVWSYAWACLWMLRSKPATANGNMCVLMGKRSRCRSIYPYPRWTRVPWASKGRCSAAENHRAHASVHGECGRFW